MRPFILDGINLNKAWSQESKRQKIKEVRNTSRHRKKEKTQNNFRASDIIFFICPLVPVAFETAELLDFNRPCSQNNCRYLKLCTSCLSEEADPCFYQLLNKLFLKYIDCTIK